MPLEHMMRPDLINNRFFIMFRFQMNSSAARSYCLSCTQSYRALHFNQVPQLHSQPLYWYVTFPEILRYRTCKLRIRRFHAALLAQNLRYLSEANTPPHSQPQSQPWYLYVMYPEILRLALHIFHIRLYKLGVESLLYFGGTY